jgi:hypothetical protein
MSASAMDRRPILASLKNASISSGVISIMIHDFLSG